ncbi:MAG: hypothetical protein R2881_10345 [Eubacteriales bacterium]
MPDLTAYIGPIVLAASEILTPGIYKALGKKIDIAHGKKFSYQNIKQYYFPCSNLNWEYVASPVANQDAPQLTFDFNPTIKGEKLYPDWISLVCKISS